MPQMWFDEIYEYLRDVIGMSEHQIKAELDKRFADLLERPLLEK